MKESTQPRSGLRDAVDRIARERPAKLVVIVFALIIALFTALLCLPIATAGPGGSSFIDALFTAVSAVCVTGLSVVDTATHWTSFGHVVIMIGIMIGGLGVMTLASILGRAVSRRIGLTQRLLAAQERKTRLGEVGSLLTAVLVTSLTVEFILTLVLIPSFTARGEPLVEAIWHALFMAVSIFNNAGFVIIDGGLAPLVGNWFICLPIIAGTVVGAIGFPVVLDVYSNWRSPKKLSLHSKLTITTYAALWVVAVLAFALLETGNDATLGGLSLDEKILATLLHATTPRSSGLSTLEVADMTASTQFTFDALMFIGGGSGSTAGGIKVTTFAVLLLAIVAEARGDRDMNAFGWRIPPATLRLAVSATVLGATLVGVGTLALLHISGAPLSEVLFEVLSAFATCGLSIGLSPILPASGKLVLVLSLIHI